MTQGTVVEVQGGVYTVALDDGRRVDASLRGRIKQAARSGEKVVIGDRVDVVEAEGGAFAVEGRRERRNAVTRTGAGGRRAKVLAANLDRLFVVVAAEPPPPPRLVDRLLAVAEANEVPPVLVLNKMDLPGAAAVAALLTARYAVPAYRVLTVSAASGRGMEPLRALFCEGVSAVIGPSGVGKSTLLNAVEPGLGLRTGELSGKGGGGRHTTVSSRMIALGCGGLVADTPGFSDVGLWGMDPRELDLCFPEMRALRDRCRFRGCAHLSEPGCAVRDAMAEAALDPGRYESYVTLRGEAEAALDPGR